MKEGLFSEAAEQPAGNDSVMNLYEILLGRDPETSFVIEEAKFQPLSSLFRSFVGSAEFVAEVVEPIHESRRLRHELTAPAPTPLQRAWIASLLSLGEQDEQSIKLANTWPEFFKELLRILDISSVMSTSEYQHQGDEHRSLTPTTEPYVENSTVKQALTTAEPRFYVSALQDQIASIEKKVDQLRDMMFDISKRLDSEVRTEN